MPFVPLGDSIVLEQVRVLATQRKIAWTRHAEERMVERGIDRGMVRECLMGGAFTENPFIPNRSGEVEYKFTMSSMVDGEQIVVAASLCPERKVVVITLFEGC